MHSIRWAGAAVLLALGLLGHGPRPVLAEGRGPAAVTVGGGHREFFAAHCLACHGPEKQEAGVRLDDLPATIDSIAVAERWRRVLDVLNSGDMPPEGEPRPAAAAATEFLASVSEAMVQARKALGDQGQSAPLRRLNRREYVNTIRDLLGVETSAAGLPDDTGNGAFDTFGSSLFMSSDQIRQYLENGRTALAAAFAEVEAVRSPPDKKSARIEVENGYRATLAHLLRITIDPYSRFRQWKASNGRPPKDFGFTDEAAAVFHDQFQNDGATLAMLISLEHSDSGAYLTLGRSNYPDSVRVTIPKDAAPGDYKLRVRAGLAPDAKPERRFLEMTVDDGNPASGKVIRVVDLFEVQGGLPGQLKPPQVIEVPVRITPGGHREFSFQEKRHADTETDTNFRYHQSIKATGFATRPAIWVDWLEWEGPLPDPAAEGRAVRLLGSVRPEETDASARQVLESFATRAFRGVRPRRDFLDRLVAVHQARRAVGGSFLEALQEPMAIVLASPGFLYLHEPPPQPRQGDAGRQRLSDLEIASRLSYFLWSSAPDEQLLAAAADGALRQPKVLEAQVERMVADPKSFALAKGFTHQWLSIDRLDFFQFNVTFYPAFDESAREASKREVYHTFHTLLRDNIDARSLLESDFVVVNAAMASYYGLTEKGEPIHGMDFRRVALPPESPRGGLLGMAAILAMGSNGERTSPVERGVWVLRKLVNDPPPPAPPNVPQLSRLDGKAVSPKERLRMHQEEPQCAQCHRRIDPIGFALECFDAVGQWRTVDEERKIVPGEYRVKVERTWPLETAGQFRDGTPFKDYFELRDRIVDRGDAFLKGLVENLFQYAVGRPVSFADAETIAGIVTRAKASGGGLRDITRDIALTAEFQTK